MQLPQQALDHASRVLEQNRHDLMSRPGVLGVGLGALEDNSQPAIVVYVDKTSRSMPQMPAQVDKVPVRIVMTDPFIGFWFQVSIYSTKHLWQPVGNAFAITFTREKRPEKGLCPWPDPQSRPTLRQTVTRSGSLTTLSHRSSHARKKQRDASLSQNCQFGDGEGNVIATQEHAGEFKDCWGVLLRLESPRIGETPCCIKWKLLWSSVEATILERFSKLSRWFNLNWQRESPNRT